MDIIIQTLNLSLATTGLRKKQFTEYSPVTKANCSDGVYIHTNKEELWLPQFFGLCEDRATSIAFIKGERKLLISLNGSEKDIPLLPGGKNTSLKQYSSADEALFDFNGYDNTDALFRADSEAAKFCKELGSEWYIPAMGEKQVMFEKKKEIDTALTIAGGEPLFSGWHWTSTRYSDGSYWIFNWYDGGRHSSNLSNGNRVRPVSAFL